MRIPVSAPQNIWFNSQNVDDSNLTLEQNYNNQIQTGIINNHFGSGVLPDALVPHIFFDSANAQGLLDGKALNPQAQPSDSNNGNQLEVELTESLATGKRTVKVLIVGLDFQNNLQYDRFVFSRNEKQISSKHYRTILTILFNDFIGTTSQSFNLGGRIFIREAGPLTLSRDCVMIAQDTQPNLFFRDFFVSSGGTIANVLATALPSYNIDSLNITTGYSQLRSLVENDVSSQVAQKFLTTTNNIQKITLLMSVINNTTPTDLAWTGNLLVSIYQLQSTVACPTDVVPQLAIDFDPSNIPLAQLSITYDSLLSAGTQLTTVPQPVDFIFSNTSVGSGLAITSGNYYVVSVKRAGSADKCQIQFAVGSNSSSVTRETLFSSGVWVDIPEESLWFQVWTDAAKLADGQAYDAGRGVQVPKNQIDQTTGLSVDYVLRNIQFVRNDLYYALVQATTKDSVQVQDERTGEPVFTEQQAVPSVSLFNSTQLANIQSVSGPLIVGTISDQNVKTYSASNATLSASFHEYGMVGNQVVIKVITDSTDGYRYDQNIIELVSEIVNGNLNGAKFFPNSGNASLFYRIAKAELISMMYGDVNGDGVVDQSDLFLAEQLINSNLNVIPSYNQYIQQTQLFVSDLAFLHWQIVDSSLNVIASGMDGILTQNPQNGTQANFNSMSANFNSIANLGSLNIIISGSVTSAGNNGTFSIVSLFDNHNITIQKQFFTSEAILQIMRGDISGDMVLDTTDVGFLQNYINAVPPIPAITSPANRIGTSFNAIRLTVEEYVDRADDYPLSSTRNTNLHPVPDMFLDGYALFAGQDLKTNPLPFSVVKQLVWDQSSVVVSSLPRLVPAAFTYQSGFVNNNCKVIGEQSQIFPAASQFDPGRNDIFIPNNLIMNDGGQFIRPDGYFMKVDFEMSTVLIEIPEVSFDMEHSVNLFTDFVADFSGTGYTRLGYPAMRFADCSLVELNGLQLNQVRFGASVQSFSPQLNGLDPSCLSGIIIDGKIGVSIDYSTGLLTLNFTNLYQDPVKQTLNTKIQITVYLKKAGWNNNPIFVNSEKAQNILGVPTPPPSAIIC